MNIRIASLAVSMFLASSASVVMAGPAGPAYPPPGGVTLGESGNFGRAGGATWTYQDLDFSAFVDLWWGPSDGSSIRLAFDGAFDDPSETLTFSLADSDLANGKGVWVGSAGVPLQSGGTEPVTTRFTLRTKTLGGTPIAMIDPAAVGISSAVGLVAPVNGDYKAEFIFEAKRVGDVFKPATDLYDAMPTPTGAENNVKLSFNAGFFWNPVCGDGNVEGDEDCDEGEANGTLASCCDASCSFEPEVAACDDGDLCTHTDRCDGAGTCAGTTVECVALDQCHVPGTCDAESGECDDPEKSNGSACQDGDACTIGDTCQSGVCEAGGPTLLEPLSDVNQTVQCVVETVPVP